MMVVSKNDDRSKHEAPKLENEAPKTRNLPALYKTRDSPLLSHWANANTAGIKHDLTNRMQFKTIIQVELRGAANTVKSYPDISASA